MLKGSRRVAVVTRLSTMSLSDPASDTAHFLSDDSEAEEPGSRRGHAEGAEDEEEEPVSGVSVTRARLTVAVLCYINLLNYMDRFTVAGRLASYKPAALLWGCWCHVSRVLCTLKVQSRRIF